MQPALGGTIDAFVAKLNPTGTALELECIARYQLDPAHCWMVGDRVSDLEAGLSAGIRAAAVCTGKHDAAAWAALTPPGVPVFSSFATFVKTLT